MIGSKKYIVVSYHTDDRYREYARALAESMKQFEIPYFIAGLSDLGGWYPNVHRKPAFIKTQLETDPDRDVVYVDADTFFEGVPEYFEDREINADLMVPMFDERPLEGVLYIRNTAASTRFLDLWEAENKAHPDRLCHKNFQAVMRGGKARAFFQILPPEYCWFEPAMRAVHPAAKPVIRHFHASQGTHAVRTPV